MNSWPLTLNLNEFHVVFCLIWPTVSFPCSGGWGYKAKVVYTAQWTGAHFFFLTQRTVVVNTCNTKRYTYIKWPLHLKFWCFYFDQCWIFLLQCSVLWTSGFIIKWCLSCNSVKKMSSILQVFVIIEVELTNVMCEIVNLLPTDWNLFFSLTTVTLQTQTLWYADLFMSAHHNTVCQCALLLLVNMVLNIHRNHKAY